MFVSFIAREDAKSDEYIRADAANGEGKLHRDKGSSQVSIGELGRPDRNNGVEMPATNTSYDASKRHPREILCRSLKGRSNDSPHAADRDGSETSNLVRVNSDEDSP